MNRLEALERVAEAARRVFDRLELTPSTPWELHALRAALDTLPPEGAGETVEAAVWEEYGNGALVLIRAGGAEDRQEDGWTRLGTTRLVLKKDARDGA